MNPQTDVLRLFGKGSLSFESIIAASPYDFRMTKDCIALLWHHGHLERNGTFYRITESGLNFLKEVEL